MKNRSLAFLLVVANVASARTTNSETPNTPADTNAAPAIPTLQIDAGKVTGKVSPTLYGLMTEEINFSYEGGLYGELIRNRAFKANPTNAIYWSTVGDAAISLDTNQPLNAALNVSLKLAASKASKAAPVGISNGGYWGIPVRPHTTYHASLYAKAKHFNGALTVSLESADGKTIFASAAIPNVSGGWKKYDVTLTTGDVAPSKENKLVITTTKPGNFFSKRGTIWFQQVSLFPPTYQNRPNGLRPDLMRMMADMKPKFLRFPGGNYLEGSYFRERFNWKNTIGDISRRPGHRSPWNYWSTDGFGLLEFLGWCEDLKMEPVLGVFAGYALKGERANPGLDLEPYVEDALDEIEYVTGDMRTKWGAQRAKDGHPAPFPLRYVEIGNEDGADKSHSYHARFAQFYDAIKAKYPNLQCIDTCGPRYWDGFTAKVERKPDLIDEHAYYKSQEEMEAQAYRYDTRSRDTISKIFAGEWATRVGSPTPNMGGALGDAAWLCGLERNSDLVVMECYAPLFVNVSDLKTGGSMQWPSDLIGYDALNSYGSPSYYAQAMFSGRHGDEILATDSQDIPRREWQPRARRDRNGKTIRPPVEQVPRIFFNATRDSKSGIIYLKVVNSFGAAQPVKVEISGATVIEPEGKAIVLKANQLEDTNSIQEPNKIVPAEETASGLGASFTREFPPYSITVLELNAK